MAQKQKIWLTGSRGFIGKHVAMGLRNSQVDLTCFTQKIEGQNSSSADPKLVYIDYLDPVDIKDKVDHWGLPDLFIHVGWAEFAHAELPIHLKENVQSGKNLIEGLFKLGLKKFLFVGTKNQYGNREGPLSEDMEPVGDLTNYAIGKNEVEKFGLKAAKEFGKIFISARTFFVFGSGQRQGTLINDLFQAHLKGTSVSLSPCEHYRDYIHVSDVVEGLRRISAIDESVIVNLGSGQYVQLKDFVIEFWKKLGGDMDKLKFGVRALYPGEPQQLKNYADLTRLNRLTQWKPALSLEEGIIKTIEDLSHSE
jgi:nucleoside-diphosphate-sugar epimerase